MHKARRGIDELVADDGYRTRADAWRQCIALTRKLVIRYWARIGMLSSALYEAGKLDRREILKAIYYHKPAAATY